MISFFFLSLGNVVSQAVPHEQCQTDGVVYVYDEVRSHPASAFALKTEPSPACKIKSPGAICFRQNGVTESRSQPENSVKMDALTYEAFLGHSSSKLQHAPIVLGVLLEVTISSVLFSYLSLL